jgi:hypothetical protein
VSDLIHSLGVVLGLLVPLLVKRYLSASSPAIWPPVSALCATLGLVALITWSPVQALLMPIPKTSATAAVAFIGALVAGGAYVIARQHEDQQIAQDPKNAPLNLAISVTGIQSGPWDTARVSGTDSLVHGWRVILTPVRVTNRSSSDRMNLRFRLRMALLKNERGNSTWEAEAVVRGLDAAGQPEPPHYPGPLDLAPQTTQTFSLMSTAMPGAELLFGRMQLNSRGDNILTVEDLVSGKILNVKVPTSMGGVLFRTR